MIRAPQPTPFEPDTPLASCVVPAVNVEPRGLGATPRFLILHYTGMSCAQKAVQWLACAQSRVSCHYVVDDDGITTQLVPEKLRAWHAGVSVWDGITDVNSASIGIEIQNPGHEDGYPDFTASQMAAVARLSADICARNAIAPWHVLAHSDIAPHRKIDPGEKFAWSMLADVGVGHWVVPVPLKTTDLGFGAGYAGPAVGAAQLHLSAYGYGVPKSGVLDDETASVLRAFQRHFRPDRIDGRLDRSTVETLESLLVARRAAERSF